MRFLFVHQNFPGQFVHLLRDLVRDRAHEIMFITEPNANEIQGVRKLTYQLTAPSLASTHRDAQEFELSMRRAEAVAGVARHLRRLGFRPDIIIGHEGWGEMLSLPDIWPDTPRIGYREFYYRLQGGDLDFDPEFPPDPAEFSRIRAKNAVNLLSLTDGAVGITPTRFQQSTYPVWAQPGMMVLPEGVDLDLCHPDPAAASRPFAVAGHAIPSGAKLLSFVARDLEPYRGFHILMRALPRLLAARPDLHVVLVGGDGVSYGMRPADGTWRDRMMREVGAQIDPDRVHFTGKLSYADYLRVLQRSDTHVYLTYPFVASWSLREAIACGCAVVASDTGPVREFIQHGKNGLLTPFLDPMALADRVLEILADPLRTARLRHNARRFAEANLRMDYYIRDFRALIDRTIAGLNGG